MSDIFGRVDQVLQGGLSSDSMFMSWPELAKIGGGLGLLIQNVGLDYRQPIRRIFELGPGLRPVGVDPITGRTLFQNGIDCDFPPDGLDAAVASSCLNRTQPTYYIIGRPEGRIQFGNFVGPNALTFCFYRKYGNPCSPNVLTIAGKAGCSATDGSARKVTWIANGVTLDGLSFNATAQEMVMQAGVTGLFAGLNIQVDGQSQNCPP